MRLSAMLARIDGTGAASIRDDARRVVDHGLTVQKPVVRDQMVAASRLAGIWHHIMEARPHAHTFARVIASPAAIVAMRVIAASA
jgi:hypothetical protein